ncbi:hypothetical protein M153_13000013237 [Pseudoloma neurophilia]|uniref:Uncharacterized protein n=1 Tax=Pseudoloma neurophilia TaxID=146866 RepID=A0A0R0LZU4_9MICR|nr:hypothetical protein M153_13000013237 [Pseudoloma neurophilia]
MVNQKSEQVEQTGNTLRHNLFKISEEQGQSILGSTLMLLDYTKNVFL